MINVLNSWRLVQSMASITALLIVLLCGSVVAVGLMLARPVQCAVGLPPPDLNAQVVAFPSLSGATLHGWLAPGRAGGGIVVLMHGVRANRLAMLQRAVVLHQHGFGVLLFDFQAHGESLGQHITFGHLEGLDAASAVAFARQRVPGERIGVIGVSLGGAAALLGPKPLNVDALVLESVFPDIHAALTDRLRARLGPLAGPILAPLIAPPFEWLMPRILGVRLNDLRPIDRIADVRTPLLVASGTADAYTTIAGAQALFAHAPQPKQFWPVPGAAHVDLERHDAPAYWAHILPFLTTQLQIT